jgi:hypothetical protein
LTVHQRALNHLDLIATHESRLAKIARSLCWRWHFRDLVKNMSGLVKTSLFTLWDRRDV